MPNPNKAFSSNVDQDFNIILFILLIVAIAGSLFLAWIKVDAGYIYTLMFTVGMCVFVLIQLFVKGDTKLEPITKWIRIPFAINSGVAIVVYILGSITPFLIDWIGKLFNSTFSVTSFNIPLFANSIREGVQSFSVAEATNSMAWKLFTITHTAGTMETFIYSFIIVFVFVLIGAKLFESKFAILSFAFGMSVLGFGVSHLLNGTYTTSAFLVAGLFLLVSNISIYLGGMFLLYWVGFHRSNNLLYLIKVEGLKAVASGYLSWYGLFELIMWGAMIFYLIKNWDKIYKKIVEYARG